MSSLIALKCLVLLLSDASINQIRTSTSSLYSLCLILFITIYPYRVFKTRKNVHERKFLVKKPDNLIDRSNICYSLKGLQARIQVPSQEWIMSTENCISPLTSVFLGVLTGFTKPLTHKDRNFH